jgi:chromate transporter
LREISSAFLKLGLISFGGPIAHLGYLRAEFVAKRRWLDEAAYGDLVALCQFVPGPASSQVVFSLGMMRAGLPGAVAASLSFTLPSAIIMTAFAYGVASIRDLGHAGWLHGLKVAALAVVAQAVWRMGRNLCPDRARVTLCLVSAAFVLLVPAGFFQVAVIAVGALVGWALYRGSFAVSAPPPKAGIQAHVAAAAALAAFVSLLVVLPVAASSSGAKWIAMFDGFYRSGALVFGGGHVVLPLLRAEVVPRGWLTDDQFLAGYGAAQAIPGPLFTFAAYLGTAMVPGASRWLGGAWCLLAIFLPGWLLIGGLLPFWHQLRAKAWAQAAMRGANSAVVGILLAALYNPVFIGAVKNIRDVAAALIAFGLLEIWRVSPWIVVLLAAAAGQFALGR